MTPLEIKSLQKTGIDWLGNPLTVDGLWGPKTEWWAGITSLSPLRQEVIRIELAYAHMGMKEDNTGGIENGGTFVDMLLAPVGLHNKPWCASFVSHCMRKAGVKWPVYYSSAYQMREWGKKENLMVTDPIPADIEVIIHDHKPGDTQVLGHVRLITGYDPATQTTAGVDGNCSNSVRCGYRHANGERYFLRPPALGGNVNSGLTFPSGMMNLDHIGDR